MSNNAALKTLFFYNGIFVFAANLLGPLYAIFALNFTNKVFTVSFSWFIFLFATTIFTLLVSRFGDRIKEKEYILMAGFLIRAISWALFIYVQSLTALILIQVLLALGEALGSPAFDAIFSQHLDKNKRVCEYSQWKIVSNLVNALATLVGGYVVTNFGFNVIFLAMSLLALFSFFGILTKPRTLL